jgi:hypothetical protein
MVSFKATDLAKVPHLTSYPMQVIAIWAEIDSILAEILPNSQKQILP